MKKIIILLMLLCLVPLCFGAAGEYMYHLDGNTRYIHQYNLSTPFDVTTAVWDYKFSTVSQEVSPEGFTFNDDGTKMYLCGLADEVNEYNLTEAFNIQTAVYNQVLSVTPAVIDPRGIDFSNNGEKMFLQSQINDSISEYALSTPWDISTATFTDSYSILAQDTSSYGVFFSNDGLYFYVNGLTGDNIYQYNMSTAFDVSTADYVQTQTVTGDDSLPRGGVAFSPDGSQMFFDGDSNHLVYEYALSIPWDITSLSLTHTFNISGEGSSARDIQFSSYVAALTVDFYEFDPINNSNISSGFLPYTQQFEFNMSETSEEMVTCVLKQDTIAVNTTMFNASVQTLYNISQTWDSPVNFSTFKYELDCNDSLLFSYSDDKYLNFLLDNSTPEITWYSPLENGSTVTYEAIDLNITFTDNNLYNISVDLFYPNGTIKDSYSNTSMTVTEYTFFKNYNLSADPYGTYLITAKAADGHTTSSVDFASWDLSKDKGIINFGNCKIIPSDTLENIKDYDYNCQMDRCTWTYEYLDFKNQRVQYVECKDPIVYLPDSQYKGHFISGDNWIDFEDESDTDISVRKITNHKYEVTYLTAASKITTRSIGELNTIEENVTFSYEDTPAVLNITISDSLLLFGSSDIDITWSIVDASYDTSLLTVTSPSNVIIYSSTDMSNTTNIDPAYMFETGTYTVLLWTNDTENDVATQSVNYDVLGTTSTFSNHAVSQARFIVYTPQSTEEALFLLLIFCIIVALHVFAQTNRDRGWWLITGLTTLCFGIVLWNFTWVFGFIVGVYGASLIIIKIL